MITWILIVNMFSPGGDYIGRYSQEYETRRGCILAKQNLDNTKLPMQQKVKTECTMKV